MTDSVETTVRVARPARVLEHADGHQVALIPVRDGDDIETLDAIADELLDHVPPALRDTVDAGYAAGRLADRVDDAHVKIVADLDRLLSSDDWLDGLPLVKGEPEDDAPGESFIPLAEAKAAHPAYSPRTTGSVATDTLLDAARIVDERGAHYDADGTATPERSLTIVAGLWSAYLGITLEATDAAALMALLKIGRLVHAPNLHDTWLDLAGYAGLGAEAAQAAQA